MNAAAKFDIAANYDVVHESETQRQHVRVKIPARVFFKVNGTPREYATLDVSAGGFSFASSGDDFTIGQEFHGSLAIQWRHRGVFDCRSRSTSTRCPVRKVG